MVRIAVASCARLVRVSKQSAWERISDAEPDAVLLLGDNIYLDNNKFGIKANTPQELSRAPELLKAQLERLYRDQFKEPRFLALMKKMRLLDGAGKLIVPPEPEQNAAKVFAIYDDHDFLGDNRCGADAVNKEFLRFVARDAFVARFGRRRTAKPIYSVTRNVNDLVDIYILDCRFHRKSSKGSQPTNENAVLGRTQWDWLTEELGKDTTAKYTLIMSSTTVHNFDKNPLPDGDKPSESWQRLYDAAFRRLKDLLAGREGTLVVSGDIHRNAIRRESGDLVEIVSSGVATTLTPNEPDKNERANYAILDFDAEQLTVTFHTLAPDNHPAVPIKLDGWPSPPLPETPAVTQ